MGYQYLRARHYDPATGQLLTRDPIEAITRDAYGYAANNPVNNTDPTGLDTYHECAKGQVWSSGNGGCIMIGSGTPAVIHPGEVGAHEGLSPGSTPAEAACDSPTCRAVKAITGPPGSPPSTLTDAAAQYGAFGLGLLVIPTKYTPTSWFFSLLLGSVMTDLDNCPGYTGYERNVAYNGVPRYPSGS